MRELRNEQFFTDIPLDRLQALPEDAPEHKAWTERQPDDVVSFHDGYEPDLQARGVARILLRQVHARARKLEWD